MGDADIGDLYLIPSDVRNTAAPYTTMTGTISKLQR